MFIAVSPDSETVRYLVFGSDEKKKLLMRDNGAWHHIYADEVLEGLRVHDVDLSFVEYFDKRERDGKEITVDDALRFERGVTAALAEKLRGSGWDAELRGDAPLVAAPECPPATVDIVLNLKNRQVAIDDVGYGPLNPSEPNDEFWAEKADRWSVSADDAKKSVCGNCAAFVVTTKMRACIAAGLEAGGSSEADAWDTIDAGDLGYCEALDFKCAASRTCDAWITGGPITDEKAEARD